MSERSTLLADSVDELLAGVDPGYLPFIDISLLKKALTEIDKLGDTDRIMPPRDLVFEWLRYFGPDDAVGCIVGQDPYPSDAIGVCFAKRASSGMPKSFEPIVRCLESQGLMKPRARRHADLRPWLAQGLEMMNMALTTRSGTSKTHQAIWKPFMAEFLNRRSKYASEHNNRMFFLLWGNEAKNGVGKVAKKYGHVTFEWTHPSPMSDNLQPEVKKFVNCTNFMDANNYLKSRGLRAFSWDNIGTVMAFADGACGRNGEEDATGGFGVLAIGGQFGRTTARGVVPALKFELIDKARPETGFQTTKDVTPVTNNRAELLALCWTFLALLRGFAFGDIEVFSDSKVSIQTLNEWLPARRRKGTSHQLENFDLLTIAESLSSVLRSRATSLAITHVRASHDRSLKKTAGTREKILWEGNDVVDKDAKKAKDDQSPPLEIISQISTVRSLVALVPADGS